MRAAFVTNNASRSPSAHRRPAHRPRRPGHRGGRRHLRAGRGPAARRAAARRRPGPGRRRHWAAHRAARAEPAAGLHRRRAPRGRRAGLLAGTSATPCWPRPPWPSGPAPGTSRPTPTRRCPRRAARSPATAPSSQLLVTATGAQPVVAGKPEPPLHAESVRRTGARRPLVVGDRLDTDIEGAVRGHADSLLVLTGVSTPGRRDRWPRRSAGPPTWPATSAACSPRTRRSPPPTAACAAAAGPPGSPPTAASSACPAPATRWTRSAPCAARPGRPTAPVTPDVAAAALRGLDLPS